MPRGKTVVQDEPQEEVAVEVVTPVRPTVFNVYNGNSIARTYSIETHGEEAEELAKKFASKFGYQIK